MADPISTLSCPSCGGKLEITKDIDRFACGHCGREHIVQRGGGIVSLKPVLDSLQGVKLGVDRTAAELAIPRLEKEISQLEAERKHQATGCSTAIFGVIVGLFLAYLVNLIFEFEMLYLLFGAVGFYLGDQLRQSTNKDSMATIDKQIADKRRQLYDYKRKV